MPEQDSDPKISNNAIDVYSMSTEVDPQKLYLAYFNVVPCSKFISAIDSRALLEWFEEEYGELIIKTSFSEVYEPFQKKMRYTFKNLVLSNRLMLHVEMAEACVVFDVNNEYHADKLFEQMKQFACKKEKTSHISLVVNGFKSFRTTGVKIAKPKLSMTLNYNEDLQAVHKSLVKQLKKDYACGLYLLHGEPGTGKSTYIRYLIHQLHKKVIFLSPRMANQLDTPEFIEFLIENRNSVLVIEDAEELLLPRERGHSNISALLNITDGILGTGLGIQVIATFNTELRNIDAALLRKGRLKVLYEFKRLAESRCRQFVAKQGIDYEVTQPLTIAELYHLQETGFNYSGTKGNAIGFRPKVA